MSRIAALALTLLIAAPAHAQVMHPDAWVGEGGRMMRAGDALAPTGAIRPATRADWIGECENRLAAANRPAVPAERFEGVCRAWLDYYEQTGATAEGYGFGYAIPVSVTTSEVPGNCPPPPAAAAPPPPVRHHPVRDKRIRLRS